MEKVKIAISNKNMETDSHDCTFRLSDPDQRILLGNRYSPSLRLPAE